MYELSAKATFWAWDITLKSSKKLVLLCLADCHNADTNRCDPSIKYICEKTGLDKKTVPNAINDLELEGYLSLKKEHGKSTKYSFNFAQKRVAPKTGLPQKRVTPKTVDSTPKNGVGVTPKTGYEPITNLEENLKHNNYAVDLDVIKLNHTDYEKMEATYPNLNLTDELRQLDFELRGEKKWFVLMNTKLNYRNKNAKGKKYATSQRTGDRPRKQTPAEEMAEQARAAIQAADQHSVGDVYENGEAVQTQVD